MLDRLIWLIGWLIFIAGLGGYYYFETEPFLYRVLGVSSAAVLALGLFSLTVTGKQVVELLSTSRGEIRRVVWPNRAETSQTTFIVIVLVFIVALLIAGFDYLLGFLFGQILGS